MQARTRLERISLLMAVTAAVKGELSYVEDEIGSSLWSAENLIPYLEISNESRKIYSLNLT